MELLKQYIIHKEDYEFINSLDNDESISEIIHYGILFYKKINKEINKDNIIKDEISKLKLDLENIINKSFVNLLDRDNQNIIEINNQLNKLTKLTNNSSLLGSFGEDIFENNFKLKYPEIEIINSTKKKTKDCADFVANFDIPILIELKNYTTTISEKEIDKFKRDLINSNKKGGIMMSAKTNICKRKLYEIENVNDKLILFVPNSGVNWEIGLQIIPLFIEILKMRDDIELEIDIIPLLKDYTNELENIKSIIDKITSIRKIYDTMKNNIINDINNVYLEVVKLELECKDIINNITNKLRNQLNDYHKLNDIKYDDEKVIQYIKEKGYIEFYGLVSKLEYKMILKDDLFILDNNKIIGKVIHKRNKPYVIINIEENECLPINPYKMKMDKTNVIIKMEEIDLLYNLLKCKKLI
jgi:hypothetical protein